MKFPGAAVLLFPLLFAATLLRADAPIAAAPNEPSQAVSAPAAPAEDSASAPAASPSPPPAPPAIARLQLAFAPIRLADEPAPTADDATVIVLPKFHVRDERLDLSQRDTTTSKELLAEAKRRYLSSTYQATFGQLSAALGFVANLPSLLNGWRPNDAEASALFVEDERIRRKRESQDLVDLLDPIDPAAASELRRAVSDAFRRPPPLGPRRQE